MHENLLKRYIKNLLLELKSSKGFNKDKNFLFFVWSNGELFFSNDKDELDSIVKKHPGTMKGLIYFNERKLVIFNESKEYMSKEKDFAEIKRFPDDIPVIRDLIITLPEIKTYKLFFGSKYIIYVFHKSPSSDDYINDIQRLNLKEQPYENVLDYYNNVKEHESKYYKPGSKIKLYHGTSSSRLKGILKYGLMPHSKTKDQNRQWQTSGAIYDNNAIYLADTIERALYYSTNAFKNNPGDIPIVLEVELEVDNKLLRADDDWLSEHFGEDSSKYGKHIYEWEKSLREKSQVSYIGRIPPNRIKVVYPEKYKDDLDYILDINLYGKININEDSIESILSKLYLISNDLYDKIYENDEDNIELIIKIAEFIKTQLEDDYYYLFEDENDEEYYLSDEFIEPLINSIELEIEERSSFLKDYSNNFTEIIYKSANELLDINRMIETFYYFDDLKSKIDDDIYDSDNESYLSLRSKIENEPDMYDSEEFFRYYDKDEILEMYKLFNNENYENNNLINNDEYKEYHDDFDSLISCIQISFNIVKELIGGINLIIHSLE